MLVITAAVALTAGCGGDPDKPAPVRAVPATAEPVPFVILIGGVRFEVVLSFDKMQLPTDGIGCEGNVAPAGTKWLRLPWTLRNTTQADAPVPPLAFSLQKPSGSGSGDLDKIDLDLHAQPAPTCSAFVLRTNEGVTGTVPALGTMYGTITTAVAAPVPDPSQWALELAQTSDVEGDPAAVRATIRRNYVIAAG